MCGIAGEVGNRRFVSGMEHVCRKMTETLSHRGPDEDGYFTEIRKTYAVHLGMRRLSIIDREDGHQPMGEDLALVFNGEIYNHGCLRDRLKEEHVKFNTRCDTEVISNGWRQTGSDIIQELDGMFAFAVWDMMAQRLYLVRDRIGKKPLYYWWDRSKGILVFGSEIKAILAHPLYERKINREAIYHYLCLQYCPEPMTAFEGIKAVQPGCFLTFDPKENHVWSKRYWSLKADRWNDKDYAKNVSYAVRQAVVKRLESEVPLGVYLSGGVDSSIITGVMRNELGPHAELHTFSMGFLENNFNELPFAEEVAKQFGTIHHEEMVTEVDLHNMAERIACQYDQPFGDCSAIPTMLMAEASKKYITVSLSGDGGDEIFGGYSRYWVANAHTGMAGYIPFMLVWPPMERSKLITPEFSRMAKTADWSTVALLAHYADRYTGKDVVNQMGFLDTLTYLPNDIIVKMERATMAHSVEARCPFLDTLVLDVGFSIPSHYKVDHRQQCGKLILKQVFSDMLSGRILHREKRGFAVPIGEWFRRGEGTGLLVDTVYRPDFGAGLFDQRHVQDYVAEHMAGRMNIGHPLWLLVQFDLWYRRFFDGKGG